MIRPRAMASDSEPYRTPLRMFMQPFSTWPHFHQPHPHLLLAPRRNSLLSFLIALNLEATLFKIGITLLAVQNLNVLPPLGPPAKLRINVIIFNLVPFSSPDEFIAHIIYLESVRLPLCLAEVGVGLGMCRTSQRRSGRYRCRA